jgi:hypothetical protein
LTIRHRVEAAGCTGVQVQPLPEDLGFTLVTAQRSSDICYHVSR